MYLDQSDLNKGFYFSIILFYKRSHSKMKAKNKKIEKDFFPGSFKNEFIYRMAILSTF